VRTLFAIKIRKKAGATSFDYAITLGVSEEAKKKNKRRIQRERLKNKKAEEKGKNSSPDALTTLRKGNQVRRRRRGER